MDKEIEIDALVVGAGMGGIYATYRLSQIGLDVKCIDIAGDVGGTWYWNTYPGAMSDTESYLYRYSWDKDDLQTYPWSNHYLYQPEILQYLCHIVDKHGLRRFMVFNVEMTSAQWDQDLRRWKVALSTGQSILARYLVNSLDLPGLGGMTRSLLRAGKLGSLAIGSTGIQVMTAVAPIVSELKSFQRHPHAYREEISSNYDSIWQNVRSSAVGFGVPEVSRKTMEATLQERRKAFQEVWDQGNGFRFMFSAFGDLTTDEVANEEACEFIRGKIDDTVKDPRKAAILKPRDLYARRPLCDSGYYQIYNRDNVDVIDLEMNPIVRVTEQGVAMSDGTIHQLAVLIFATGFDAIEGNYLRLGITGRHGKTIQEHWQNGPTAYGGIACSGFPNMFLVSGPQAPFANFPPVIESEIDFIMSCIDNAERKRADLKSPHATVEVTQEAELEWSALCERLVEGSLFKKTNTTTNFYFGGLGGYRKWVDAVMADDLRGLKFLTS
ncbi:hypothetical protein EDD37DRAFT_656225 [Exophiala viscosa]|uniref:uncharacterized protein n=1 Tax=Exophiala viscosa TaxID=2486360 RepID=UPI002196A8DD|nr:hypothetical protein EDD37DRAFT_656225 [Exophiala viscosa]